jgi:hypothetical protein
MRIDEASLFADLGYHEPAHVPHVDSGRLLASGSCIARRHSQAPATSAGAH